MKKIMSILMLIAILLSLCACGAAESTQGNDQPVSGELTPEQRFGHINQLEPIDGVYQIWNAEGVKNIAKHPDATFELLCTIDMENAVLSPIGTEETPFTGELKGGNFYIKNFTVQGGDEKNFGFIGVNKGIVRDIVLENVSFIPGAGAGNIGSLAGDNQGELIRCTISGTMAVSASADNASCGNVVGRNTGKLANTAATVDVSYTADGTAVLGGIVGTAQGGTVEFVEANGSMTVTGERKTVGLFAGLAENTVFTNCVFAGSDNSLNGRLFVNFTGNETDDELIVAVNAKWRDNAYHQPLPEKTAQLRQRVVDEMYALVTFQWKTKEDIAHTCYCTGGVCSGVFSTMYAYVGVPYNHMSSSLRRAQYVVDEDGYLKDWVYDLPAYDGLQCYLGGDCSSILQQAWWTVSNSTNYMITANMFPACGYGTMPVGDYKCDFELKNIKVDGVNTKWSQQYIDANTPEKIYECYAACRYGDAIVNHAKAGGHTRMLAMDPVVIKDQAGNIDPDYSYMLMHEQGGGYVVNDETKIVTHGAAFKKFTFANLYYDWYIPISCEELLSGEMEPAEVTLEGGCDGFAGMYTGNIHTNYHLKW